MPVHRPILRDARVWALLIGLVFVFAVVSAWGSQEPFSGIERLETGNLVKDGSSSYWTIVSATSTVAPSTPEAGHFDFAQRGNRLLDGVTVSANPVEGVSPDAPLWDGVVFTSEGGKPLPTFWTAPAPATYSLTFKQPIELLCVDLTPPSRKHGFADFTVLARRAYGAELSEVEIREATVSAGATIEAGFHWRLRVAPQPAVEVSIRFHHGSLYVPRQIFLQDLDLWGRTPEGEGEVGGVTP